MCTAGGEGGPALRISPRASSSLRWCVCSWPIAHPCPSLKLESHQVALEPVTWSEAHATNDRIRGLCASRATTLSAKPICFARNFGSVQLAHKVCSAVHSPPPQCEAKPACKAEPDAGRGPAALGRAAAAPESREPAAASGAPPRARRGLPARGRPPEAAACPRPSAARALRRLRCAD